MRWSPAHPGTISVGENDVAAGEPGHARAILELLPGERCTESATARGEETITTHVKSKICSYLNDGAIAIGLNFCGLALRDAEENSRKCQTITSLLCHQSRNLLLHVILGSHAKSAAAARVHVCCVDVCVVCPRPGVRARHVRRLRAGCALRQGRDAARL